MIVKFIPLLMAAGLGSIVAFNKQFKGNSEEIEIKKMGQQYLDVEKDWGKNNNNATSISFWKREDREGFKRSKEGRPEIHKDIFIFDLCNEWVQFAGNTENREQDISEGYGYLWKDVCGIVKESGSAVSWLEFVTQVMTESNIVQVKDCCDKYQKCESNWEKGNWLPKCFQKFIDSKEKGEVTKNKKVCGSIWRRLDSNTKDREIFFNNNNCIDEEIGKKISEKIKISRNLFKEGNGSGYFCQDKNGYKRAEGEHNIKQEIKDDCRELLKSKIKEFSENKNKNRELKNKDNSVCKGLYEISRVEVKCEDGWIFRNSI